MIILTIFCLNNKKKLTLIFMLKVLIILIIDFYDLFNYFTHLLTLSCYKSLVDWTFDYVLFTSRLNYKINCFYLKIIYNKKTNMKKKNYKIIYGMFIHESRQHFIILLYQVMFIIFGYLLFQTSSFSTFTNLWITKVINFCTSL